MGNPTGFMEWKRENAPKRPASERTGDFREFSLPLAPEGKVRQSGRCMGCGVPFCHRACPLGNLIPDFNEHVHRGRWRMAYDVLASTNDFPEFTGRLCPAPCEAACVLAIDRQAVAIEQIEKEIVERAFSEGWIAPHPPTRRTGRKVAVVGSGPAGLAAAARLNRAGHQVTVFERDDLPGGLLRYGIPDFKMEKSVLDRRLQLLEAEGICFRTGICVGADHFSWAEVRRNHDAVLIAMGARRPRALDVPGSKADGVWQAMQFLEAQNRAMRSGEVSALCVAGKRVVILGGGDTGSDCLGTAHRQRAESVAQVELLPAPPVVRAASNPWPQWPLVFRTSSSQEEGGERLFGRKTVQLEAQEGKLAAIHWVDVERTSGGLQEIPGTHARREVDVLILALGFVGPELCGLNEQLGVELDARGNIRVDGRFATNVPGVFCAGDAMRGPNLIVQALADGQRMAEAVDDLLKGADPAAKRAASAWKAESG